MLLVHMSPRLSPEDIPFLEIYCGVSLWLSPIFKREVKVLIFYCTYLGQGNRTIY